MVCEKWNGTQRRRDFVTLSRRYSIVTSCHAGFAIRRRHMCGFVIRNIHADGSDYKSDSFITPDCKS